MPVMALEGLVKRLADRFRGRNVLQYIRMPSLAVVADIEAAEMLKRKYDQKKLIVVHSPEYLEQENQKYGSLSFKLGGEEIEGLLIHGSAFSKALVQLYEREEARDETERELAGLENAVREESSRREENRIHMAQVANSFEGNVAADYSQLRELINSILTSQFECPEHFIRELIQNSAAAAHGIEGGRIDVYLDSEKRVIRVEDNGTGMTRDVMENVYFNLYRSINEALEHAAGKFGIGAVSIFGLGHDQITVDSMPREGIGGKAVIDSEMMRDEFLATGRTTHGTTIEITLSAASIVDFEKIVGLLKQDCSYVETPVYLNFRGSSEKINKLLNPNNPDSVSFDDGKIAGYIAGADRGELELLSHRIRLSSIQTRGYRGVVNFDQLDTTFSRDAVLDDPALHYVMAYVRNKAQKLRPKRGMDMRMHSLEARIADFGGFLHSNLFSRGGVNEEWINRNIHKIAAFSENRYGLFGSYEELWTFQVIEKFEDLLGSLKNKAAPANSAKVEWGLWASGLGSLAYAQIFSEGTALIGAIPLSIRVSPYAFSIAPAIIEASVRGLNKVIERKIASACVGYYGKNMVSRYDPVSEDSGLVRKAARTAIPLIPAAPIMSLAAMCDIVEYLSAEANVVPGLESRASEASQAAQLATSAQGDISILPYVGAAALGAAGIIGLKYIKGRRMFAEYNGELNKERCEFLEDVKRELDGLDVKVYYGKNLGYNGPRFVVREGAIALNMRQDYPAWAAALEYASKGIKNVELAEAIAKRNLGEK